MFEHKMSEDDIYRNNITAQENEILWKFFLLEYNTNIDSIIRFQAHLFKNEGMQRIYTFHLEHLKILLSISYSLIQPWLSI